ncbi:helix-turn-helix domain-containing protein [Psychroserpens algicola]|uniref:ATP-binding protein n=1 Tax=Psychroserpens algicola TaxID=1719034 RepID=A0ABT0HD57_9FLAO|nr:ATP-binding protein [Psychroserpens algicola]MCK8482313.1 ATP-binding protein [Psychroserpens algicola]
MTELHKIEKYDLEIVQSFIDNEIEESIHIEFKSAGALSKNDLKKKEVSKDVSAFANSNGGIIIYGIEEKNHKASEFSFINGNEFTKEWLEQIISATVNRNIPDLKIFPIRKDGDINKTIYVVQIPVSSEAPHLARDKRYYKRYNFESVPMEEYEIRQLYGRKIKSKLLLDRTSLTLLKIQDDEDEYKFKLEIDVYNDGEKMEENYKVNVYFIDFGTDIRLSQYQQDSSNSVNFTRLEDNRIKASIKGITPIYPNESLNTVRLSLSIKKESFYEVVENIKLEVRLYYPNGEDLSEPNLSKTLKELIS